MIGDYDYDDRHYTTTIKYETQTIYLPVYRAAKL